MFWEEKKRLGGFSDRFRIKNRYKISIMRDLVS